MPMASASDLNPIRAQQIDEPTLRYNMRVVRATNGIQIDTPLIDKGESKEAYSYRIKMEHP